MRDKIEQLQADIEAGVAALISGDDWQRWLRVAARSPNYSYRNTLLILQQRPDATAVMRYRAWQALGHKVRRGETSIKILAAACTRRGAPTTAKPTMRTRRRATPRPAECCEVSASPTSSTSPRSMATPSSRPRCPSSLTGSPRRTMGQPFRSDPSRRIHRPPRRDPESSERHHQLREPHGNGRGSPLPSTSGKTLAHELGHVLLHHGTEYERRRPPYGTTRDPEQRVLAD